MIHAPKKQGSQGQEGKGEKRTEGGRQDDAITSGIVSLHAGCQPLDAVLIKLGLTNHDIVTGSPEPLTHKQVQKGRKGRMLTRRLQERITRALNAKAAPVVYRSEDLFNYRGRL